MRQTASLTQQLTAVDAVHRCRFRVLLRRTHLACFLAVSAVCRILQVIEPVRRDLKCNSAQRTKHVLAGKLVLTVPFKATEAERVQTWQTPPIIQFF